MRAAPRKSTAALVAALALTLTAAGAPVAGAAPAHPPRAAAIHARAAHGRAARASRARVQAFLLTGAPDSFADLRAHAAQVGVVYPTYYECERGSGRLAGVDVQAIDGFARANRIALMPRFTCQDGATVHRLLTDPVLRAATLAALARLAARHAFDGVCVDLENDGARDREALSSFVAALARELHAHGRRLTVVVDGVSEERSGSSTAFYDDSALAAAADTVFVLAWGAHWAGSSPGPLAPLSDVAGAVHHVASLPHRSRFVIGAPMYGIDWAQGASTPPAGSGASQTGPAGVGKAYQYSGIRSLQGASGVRATRDAESGEMTFAYTDSSGVAHSVWYMDARAVLDVLAIARADGLRVGLWRLGEEDQSMWSSPLLGALAG